MNHTSFLKRLNRIYAAEDFFPGVLGNPNRVAPLPKPVKPSRTKSTAQKRAGVKSIRAA